ncbi:253_t:CDS:2, partial [Funneliformis caledonium]
VSSQKEGDQYREVISTYKFSTKINSITVGLRIKMGIILRGDNTTFSFPIRNGINHIKIEDLPICENVKLQYQPIVDALNIVEEFEPI